MHSGTKFECNFAVIGVVHSGITMIGSYFSAFRWDENCCNSLHKYKDYPKTHPLPQYAQIINFILITKCSSKWYWRHVAQHARDIRGWHNSVQYADNIVSYFTWDHLKFKVWVITKVVPCDGVPIKEYVSEILKNFDKFQVTSSMKALTTNLNGPFSPTVTRPSEGWTGCDTVGIS